MGNVGWHVQNCRVILSAAHKYLMASLEAMAAARTEPGPEWVQDLYWQVAAGLISGDEAASILIEQHLREYPHPFVAAPPTPAPRRASRGRR